MTLGHREWQIGAHLLHFEPPDLLWVKYQGGVSLPEAVRMVDVSRELGSVRPFFMIGDMKEAGLPETEAGRYLSENLRTEWLLGAVYISTRLVQRAAAQGIFVAAYLTEHTTDARALKLSHFVPTREAACELLDRLRADLAATPSAVTGETRRQVPEPGGL